MMNGFFGFPHYVCHGLFYLDYQIYYGALLCMIVSCFTVEECEGEFKVDMF